MMQRLRVIAVATGERARPLQQLAGMFSIAAGSAWVFGAGWALIVTGGLLLVDVVLDAAPVRRAAR